ncbi:pre-mRNA-processing factor 39-like [Corticium candelabrum]|uniref:pre-mRNA-processing factor 39-like n=1 Tax=Corticium candelabrum TaxID=121492 RepID=UPI002E27411D|nr:pre-mRNA-processing factor 39-like [Corticium candelabrum]
MADGLSAQSADSAAPSGSSESRAERERCWNAVKSDPNDFNSWTQLLQAVEAEEELEAAREAYDAFFKRFPYCYGYWKKYADLELKKGSIETALKVYRRGVKAIPLSIDLWLHYIEFSQQYVHHSSADSHAVENQRRLYEEAIRVAGLEFRSDRLWESYIDWTKVQNELPRVIQLYDRLLAMPTQQHTKHFEQVRDFVYLHPPQYLMSAQEYQTLWTEVNQGADGSIEGDPSRGLERVKDKLVSQRQAIYQQTEEDVQKRWAYEEGIKRPYFHVKALDKAQLDNWTQYLDFEVAQGNSERVHLLFERCMIACALYEEFWIKYARYMESHSVESSQEIYRRACSIHVQNKPAVHFAWALFEECHGNVDSAREILSNLSAKYPSLLSARLQLIGLEKRCDRQDVVTALYDEGLASALTQDEKSFLSSHYAGYIAKTVGDVDKAKSVLRDAVEKDPSSKLLYLHLINMELASNTSEPEILSLFDKAQSSAMSDANKQSIQQKKILFLQQFSSNPTLLKSAIELYERNYGAFVVGRKRSRRPDDEEPAAAKVAKVDNGGVDGEVVEQENSLEQQSLMQQQWAAYQAAVQANAVNPVQAAAFYQAATAGQQAMWPFQQQFPSQQQQQQT